MFSYAGTRLIANAAHDFAAGRLGRGLGKLAGLRRFFPRALADPRLLARICLSLLRGRRAAD